MDAAKVLVAGKWMESAERVEIRSPYDHQVVSTTFAGTEQMLEEAISAAENAFVTIGEVSGRERSRILAKVSDGIRTDMESFARLISLEAGKPMKAARVEVERAVFTFALAAEEAEADFEQHIDVRLPGGLPTRQGTIRWFPAGPVAAITPFNFPLNLVAHKLAPAISLGCPVVLKPAPQTPLTALKLARLILDSGLPASALSVMPMSNEVAAKLVADDRLKVLSFTGSAKVGWELKSRAGKKKVLLELGGNAAVIVHSDAPVKTAVERCIAGGFSYSGQSCISVQRIFVQRGILEPFCEYMLRRIPALKSGDPLDDATDCGPLIRESDAIRIEEWINESVGNGARLLCGGKRSGPFVDPTVLTNTKPSDKVNAEEVFGPLLVLEPYSSLVEAIDRVNASRYGLQAGIFTVDQQKIDYAYKHLQVGGVIANDAPTFRSDAMPYGGVKDSGLGREGVRFAMEEMSEMRLLVS